MKTIPFLYFIIAILLSALISMGLYSLYISSNYFIPENFSNYQNKGQAPSTSELNQTKTSKYTSSKKIALNSEIENMSLQFDNKRQLIEDLEKLGFWKKNGVTNLTMRQSSATSLPIPIQNGSISVDSIVIIITNSVQYFNPYYIYGQTSPGQQIAASGISFNSPNKQLSLNLYLSPKLRDGMNNKELTREYNGILSELLWGLTHPWINGQKDFEYLKGGEEFKSNSALKNYIKIIKR